MFSWFRWFHRKPKLRFILTINNKTMLDISEDEVRAHLRFVGGMEIYKFYPRIEIIIAELQELKHV